MKATFKQKSNRLFIILFFCVSFLSNNEVLSQMSKLDEKNLEETMRNPWKPDASVILWNAITGDVKFSLKNINPIEKTITVFSERNLDQTLLKQKVQMEVYTIGGKTVAKKTFNCAEPVILNYKNWPDGVYEFRFRCKDIRGMASFKYTSWYKGDILAAAREIVNSAPGKDVRTPEAAAHRMLSDMILDRIGKNLQNPDSSKLSALHSPLMEFAEINAKRQIRPGGFVRLAYIDDIDNTPQFCRCYLPLDYNPSTKYPIVVSLHGFNGNNPEYYNWWSADKRHDDRTDRYNVIFIEPHGRYNSGYTGIGDRDVLKCIQMAKEMFNVDDDRVYLMGHSMGGSGTLFVAEKHPDLFAAIASISAGAGDYHVHISKENIEKLSPWEIFLNDKSCTTSQLESLINMPILVCHGDRDQSVDVNYSRYIVRLLQRWNYDVQYYEVPGKDHNDIGLQDQTISWFLQHKRNAAPKQVRIRTSNPQGASSYWVEVIQINNPQEFTVVDAEVLDNNMIRVDSKNAYELSLTPDKAMIDYNKPIKVFWNGKIVLANNLKIKKIILKDDNYKPLSLHKTRQIAGPISDFQNTPFVVVIGTISNNPMMKKLIAQKAEAIVSNWKNTQKYEPRVKKDVDVTEAEMKNYSLYLLGGTEDNKVSKQLLEKTPFQIKSDEIIIDGKSFKAKDAFLNAIFPNPFNNERYINIVAATSCAGLFFFNPQSFMLAQFDYYILDGKIPTASTSAKSDKIMVATGFFNCNWKIDKAFLNEGEEELRSKCPSMVVNEDLKTRIVGAVQPSAELMNSYVGTYQIEGGGPRIRIFVENGSLMAEAQGQGTLELQATSENEFFVDMNISFIFKKNETTNEYELYGHQMGRVGKGKKVK